MFVGKNISLGSISIKKLGIQNLFGNFSLIKRLKFDSSIQFFRRSKMNLFLKKKVRRYCSLSLSLISQIWQRNFQLEIAMIISLCLVGKRVFNQKYRNIYREISKHMLIFCHLKKMDILWS